MTILRDIALPDELISSLKAAYNKMLEIERKKHLAALTQERKNLEETLKQVIELESECSGLSHTLEELKNHHQNIASAYEKKLATAESRVADSEKRENALNAKLEDLRQKLHEVEIQLAVAETKSNEYEKQLAGLKKEGQKSGNKS